MASYTLITHCPSAQISSERAFSTSLTLAQFKSRLEQLTGVPPSHQVISIHSSRTDDADQVPPPRVLLSLPTNGSADEDNITLASLNVIDRDGIGIKVLDDRPEDVARMFVDESQLKERFELTEDEYRNRNDTVLAYKQRNKLGRFDPVQQAQQEAASNAASDHDAKVLASWTPHLNARFQISDATQRRGTIRFVGNTAFAKGVWIGVEFDEPVGKNDGSVDGQRYFECKDKFGGFVKPDKIQVGDYPVEDLFDEDEEL